MKAVSEFTLPPTYQELQGARERLKRGRRAPAAQRDRARRYLTGVGEIVQALHELSALDWRGDASTLQTAVEHMSIRAGTLVDAALLALNGFAAVDRDHENLIESEFREQRRAGSPVSEPEVRTQ